MTEEEGKAGYPATLREAHFLAMGRAINSWANFEYAIDDAIWRLMGTEQARAACLTAQFNSIHQRIKAFIALVALHDVPDSILVSFQRFYGQISSAQLVEMRNRLVHDFRLINETTGEAVRYQVTANRELVFGMVPEPTGSLDDLRIQIRERIMEFESLCKPLWAAVETSGGRLRTLPDQIVRLPMGLEYRHTLRTVDPHPPEPSQE